MGNWEPNNKTGVVTAGYLRFLILFGFFCGAAFVGILWGMLG